MSRHGLRIRVDGGVFEEDPQTNNNTNNSSKISMCSPAHFKSRFPVNGVMPPMIPTAQPDSGLNLCSRFSSMNSGPMQNTILSPRRKKDGALDANYHKDIDSPTNMIDPLNTYSSLLKLNMVGNPQSHPYTTARNTQMNIVLPMAP